MSDPIETKTPPCSQRFYRRIFHRRYCGHEELYFGMPNVADITEQQRAIIKRQLDINETDAELTLRAMQKVTPELLESVRGRTWAELSRDQKEEMYLFILRASRYLAPGDDVEEEDEISG